MPLFFNFFFLNAVQLGILVGKKHSQYSNITFRFSLKNKKKKFNLSFSNRLIQFSKKKTMRVHFRLVNHFFKHFCNIILVLTPYFSFVSSLLLNVIN